MKNSIIGELKIKIKVANNVYVMTMYITTKYLVKAKKSALEWQNDYREIKKTNFICLMYETILGLIYKLKLLRCHADENSYSLHTN